MVMPVVCAALAVMYMALSAAGRKSTALLTATKRTKSSTKELVSAGNTGMTALMKEPCKCGGTQPMPSPDTHACISCTTSAEPILKMPAAETAPGLLPRRGLRKPWAPRNGRTTCPCASATECFRCRPAPQPPSASGASLCAWTPVRGSRRAERYEPCACVCKEPNARATLRVSSPTYSQDYDLEKGHLRNLGQLSGHILGECWASFARMAPCVCRN